MQIAIDTSTGIASLALIRDGGILAEMTWRCGQNHTVQLLPNLSGLLKQTDLDIASASGIIVALGPGSYNGLRVGLGTAKGLAFSLGVPLVGVSTLEVEAYQAAPTACGLQVCAIHDAGRGEIAEAIFAAGPEMMVRIEQEQITTLEALCRRVTCQTVFCGEYVPVIAAEIKTLLGDRAIIVPGVANTRRAGFLAELGLRRLSAGDYDDPSTLQPLYLRAPPITQPKDKK
jgi:tRNA threonylcarbamoyladenosine biosynthesis protein TsaB